MISLITCHEMQVTELKCGGLVIGSIFDHRVVDGYSADMFHLAWADITRSENLSMLPSYSLNHQQNSAMAKTMARENLYSLTVLTTLRVSSKKGYNCW